MNYWNLLLMFFFLCSFEAKEQEMPISFAVEEQLPKDKEFLVNYFEETGNHLEELTERLTETQLNYKIGEGRWSINQVLEHIVITEEALFSMTTELLNQPANPEDKSSTTDEELLAKIVDRTNKVQTSDQLQPTGKYSDSHAAISDLNLQRANILEFIRITPEEDLRNHIATEFPFGPLDAFQSLLFMVGHTARHTEQI